MNHSDKIKLGIASARMQGTTWGAHSAVLAQQNRRRADQFAEDHRQLILDLMLAGHRGSVRLASELNRRGVPAYRGGKWHPATVDRLLRRLPGLKDQWREACRERERVLSGEKPVESKPLHTHPKQSGGH